jgi:Ca2+-transporting ATPase
MTAPTAAPKNWHQRSAGEALAALGGAADGLSAAEAARRLAEHGRNELKESLPLSPWTIFLGQFKNLIVWILIVAGVISGVLGEGVDAIAILAIVVLNAVIGFYQEFSAEKSIAALRRMTAPRAKVRRDGHVIVVPSAEVVPGDILEIESGDLVAADARVLESASLRCVESALTGESEAVNKRAIILDRSDVPLGDRENMVFMGTSVATGQGRAVIDGH